MSAKLAVLAGAPLQASAGDVSAPLHVYCLGISAPAANAGLVRAKVVEAPPDEAELACCATIELTPAISSTTINLIRIRIGNPPFLWRSIQNRAALRNVIEGST